MTVTEYDRAVEELAALARFHRARDHPYPPAECPTCAEIERRPRALAQQCPG